MKAKRHWRGSSIHTPYELHRKMRRLNHKLLAQMRAGARLLLHGSNGKPTWLLNPGGEVAPKMALDVIKHIDVYAVGDCLFADCLAQTFRYIESLHRGLTNGGDHD
jgi:hypothetical protein